LSVPDDVMAAYERLCRDEGFTSRLAPDSAEASR
jgi:hypothetical protein